ncbi:MAG: threonine--tRNA ligase [Alphaproteobacteria bacterium]|nr:threonine--tRNA ligase [Alphaproteobacteria bacterium]
MTAADLQAQNSPVTITLPDGSTRAFETTVTGAELAASIGAGLAKAAIAVKVDGVQRDLSEPLPNGAKVSILTLKDAEGLDIMRHTTTAQVLALAVKELHPSAKLAIGPTIDNGFYYDIDLEQSLSSDDLPAIEAKMREIITRGKPVAREMWTRADAIAMFESRGESYKAELIRGAAEDDTTEAGKVSLYRQGEGEDAFIDLCRGPHVTSISKISPAFRLTKISGAYWRGDSKNKQLQRIYGVSFASEKELKEYLFMMEEAEKRDHRKLAKELDLFHLQQEAHGSVFWHPNGYIIWRALESYMRRAIDTGGYKEVKTPQVMDAKQWEQSGHWGKYRENMFVIPDEVPNVADEGPIVSDKAEWMALKPMNCPAHVLIFKQGIKSYRDLPLRIYENGCCHRNEPHGALHGLMRVRQFTQDDAHIFCREDQIVDEVRKFCELADRVYKHLGFTKYTIKLALRPEKRFGSDEMWDKAENELRTAVLEAGLDKEHGFEELPGEGAFYAPKLEWHLTDAIGRTWQVGTIQSDRVLPERLDASYIGEDGEKHRPVMLHRAIFGSYERFIGILIEQFAGRFPLWLAPTQVVVASITNDHDAYALEVRDLLRAAGIRAEADTSNSKINYKVREHSNAKVPVILAVGGRERDERTVSIRRLGSEGQTVAPLDETITKLVEEAAPPA